MKREKNPSKFVSGTNEREFASLLAPAVRMMLKENELCPLMMFTGTRQRGIGLDKKAMATTKRAANIEKQSG